MTWPLTAICSAAASAGGLVFALSENITAAFIGAASATLNTVLLIFLTRRFLRDVQPKVSDIHEAIRELPEADRREPPEHPLPGGERRYDE